MCRHMYNWNIVDCDVIQPKMNLNKKFTSLAKLDSNITNLLKMLKMKSLPFTSKEINSGRSANWKNKQVWQVLHWRRRRGGDRGGAHVCPPPPFKSGERGNKWDFAPPPPPTFGQYICSNFAICSQFVVRNAFLKIFLARYARQILFIKYFPNLANLKLKINFSYILL